MEPENSPGKNALIVTSDATLEFITNFIDKLCKEQCVSDALADFVRFAARIGAGTAIGFLLHFVSEIFFPIKKEDPAYLFTVRAAVRMYKEFAEVAPYGPGAEDSRKLESNYMTVDLRKAFEEAKAKKPEDAKVISLMIGLMALGKKVWSEASVWLSPHWTATENALAKLKEDLANKRKFLTEQLNKLVGDDKESANVLLADQGALSLSEEWNKLLPYMQANKPGLSDAALSNIGGCIIQTSRADMIDLTIKRLERFLEATTITEFKPSCGSGSLWRKRSIA
jgi:hypothetical protein